MLSLLREQALCANDIRFTYMSKIHLDQKYQLLIKGRENVKHSFIINKKLIMSRRLNSNKENESVNSA